MTAKCRDYEVYSLPEIVDSELIGDLRRRYSTLARSGRVFHIIYVDGANPHRPETAAALISILRSVREFGGEVRLIASRHEVQRMLEVTALDRIFCTFHSEAEARTQHDSPNRPKPHMANLRSRASNVEKFLRRTLSFV